MTFPHPVTERELEHAMQGHYDGQLAQLTKRHQQRQRRRKGPDERTVITGQRLPEPGEHTYPCTLQSRQCAWTTSVELGVCYDSSHWRLRCLRGQWSRCMCALRHHEARLLLQGELLGCTGDPSRTDVVEEDMVWTIRCDDLTTVTAFPLPGSPPAFGYITRESDKCEPS